MKDNKYLVKKGTASRNPNDRIKTIENYKFQVDAEIK
jgi:hypothetical protein